MLSCAITAQAGKGAFTSQHISKSCGRKQSHQTGLSFVNVTMLNIEKPEGLKS